MDQDMTYLGVKLELNKISWLCDNVGGREGQASIWTSDLDDVCHDHACHCRWLRCRYAAQDS